MADADSRFQAIFHQSSYAMVLYDKEGNCLEVNEAWEKLFKAKAEHVRGYNLFKDPHAEAKGLIPYIEIGYAGRANRIPPVYYDPGEIGESGRPRWIEMSVNPVKNAAGEVIEMVLIMKDVTEEVFSQKRLEHSEQKLRTLSNSLPQLLWITDHEGNVEFYNEHWESIDWTKSDDWTAAIDELDRRETVQKFRESLRSGQPFTHEFRLNSKKSGLSWYLAHGLPVKDKTGKVIRWYGTASEITDLKQKQESITYSLEELSRLIGTMEKNLSTDMPVTHEFYSQLRTQQLAYLERMAIILEEMNHD